MKFEELSPEQIERAKKCETLEERMAFIADEGIELTSETSADDIEEWDSLANINIIVSVEDEFGIKFDIDEITGMKNVGEMVKVIESRIA